VVPGDCSGLVTYYGSVPPTVYITVTEGFSVTVTAGNASVTASETLITPPPACQSTILPIENSFQPLATIEYSSLLPVETSSDSTESTTTTTTESSSRSPSKAPNVVSSALGGQPESASPAASQALSPEPASFTVVKSTVYATAPYTSTIIVTKKTPVVVVSPPTSAPPVFSGGNQNNNPNPPAAVNNNPPPANNPAANNNPPPASPASKPGPVVVTRPSTANPTPGLGNIIASVINSPFVAPVPTVPPRTTIANVPVAILPSTVLIGNSAVAIPAGAEVIATVSGQVFTVRPSEIIGAGTTVGLSPLQAVQVASAPVYSTQVTIAPGLVAQVAGSTAVIDGTTYRIGAGATPMTITVDGVPIGIGPFGLSLPSTTIPANAMTDAPMVVETAAGLTFSIDQSEVVIDGTTYRIGSGAHTVITEIDGQTISIGPGGVGLKTTTLKPTAATAESGSRTTTGPASTLSAGLQTGAAARIGIKEWMGWMLMVGGGGWLLL
jgi:hypothetical protein